MKFNAKTIRFACIALMSACALLANVGCQSISPSTSTTRPVSDGTAAYVQANNLATTTVNALAGFKNAGFISDAEWAKSVVPGLKALNAALDDWGNHLTDPSAAQKAFNAALPNLLEYVAQLTVKAKPVTKTTQPTTRPT